ncbi:MAG: NifU N-terminal domain-containing protein [Gemmatimonadetes bacterium]|nr:NifU N-terminal domain-containing protein [Gemmatimonadota bacterium]
MGAVRFQVTPNPNAGKFVVGRPVVAGTASKSYYGVAQAASNPVAAALFAIEGVASLFMVEDFITVTKTPEAKWQDLTPRVIAAIDAAMP